MQNSVIRTVVFDSNTESKNLIKSYFSNLDKTELKGVFDDLSKETREDEIDYKNIDLVIFNINQEQSDEILTKIESLKNKYKNISFIAVSYEIDSELVSKTLKYNVREFLLKPLIPSILETAIGKILDIKQNAQPKYANTIAVFSNKGAVGKTSLCVNLAYELAKMPQNKDERICLLDMSFDSDDVFTFLNTERKCNVDNLIANIENFDEKMFLSMLDRYKDTNLYLMSLCQDLGQSLKKYDASLIVRIINILKKFFSYIIIDTTSAIDEINVSILNNSDLILLIALMNAASVRNCQKCYELFNNINFNKEKVKLIVNRYIENTQITVRDIEKTLECEVFYKIPNNYLTLIDAINVGGALGEINPQSNIAKAYKNLAGEISNIDFMSLDDVKTYNHGVFNLLRRMGE